MAKAFFNEIPLAKWVDLWLGDRHCNCCCWCEPLSHKTAFSSADRRMSSIIHGSSDFFILTHRSDHQQLSRAKKKPFFLAFYIFPLLSRSSWRWRYNRPSWSSFRDEDDYEDDDTYPTALPHTLLEENMKVILENRVLICLWPSSFEVCQEQEITSISALVPLAFFFFSPQLFRFWMNR